MSEFSPVGSQITCEALQQANEIEIRISDQGEGVSQEALTVLGERFYRFREHTGVSGSGLGLSIVLKIVQLHHGEMTFKNKLPRGFEVIIQLPKID
ncbi:MAG: ATP-binding protein [Idiomarinaceae bacterium]|uniref:sensor histidine kinase n=1 Tax=Idiomarina sp. 28-8 TaxID=1260624 RepID=UPI000550C849|nr:ATP-binding protein [Idiomarina sp. 28-8]NWO01408.1 ATP-binding protein [Idiomarinaceae bacterium]